MTWLMQIVGIALGNATRHDGLYLKSVKFDTDEWGGCEIETTPDPEQAYQFKSTSELLETWKHQSVVRPLRDDGKPNRPMTVWTIESLNSAGAPYIKPVMHCDFCQAPDPTRMYAHPFVSSGLFRMLFPAGHWGACNRCGNMLEAGDLDGLIRETLRHGISPQLDPRQVIGEFRRIYGMISRTREAYEPPEVQRKKYS
jgi:hypothetical protein